MLGGEKNNIIWYDVIYDIKAPTMQHFTFFPSDTISSSLPSFFIWFLSLIKLVFIYLLAVHGARISNLSYFATNGSVIHIRIISGLFIHLNMNLKCLKMIKGHKTALTVYLYSFKLFFWKMNFLDSSPIDWYFSIFFKAKTSHISYNSVQSAIEGITLHANTVLMFFLNFSTEQKQFMFVD